MSTMRERWETSELRALGTTWEHYQLAARDASLGVGHVWTAVQCPAYRTCDPADCTCRDGER